MNYDIFKSDKEKAEARKSLPELTEHPGWKFIIKALDANIEYFNRELQTKKDFSSLEEVYALQDRIDDFEQFKTLPQTIVQAAEDQPEPEEDSDPFDRPDTSQQ